MIPLMNSIILTCFLSFLIIITLFTPLLLTSKSTLIWMDMPPFTSARVSEHTYLSILVNTHMRGHGHIHTCVCRHTHTHPIPVWSHAERICLPYSALEFIQNNKLQGAGGDSVIDLLQIKYPNFYNLAFIFIKVIHVYI